MTPVASPLGTPRPCRVKHGVDDGADGVLPGVRRDRGPERNLGDGDVRRTTNENPTKLAPCLVPQSDSSDDYYQKTVSWTTADTTLTAKVFLTAPATALRLLRGSPAPNPTQVLEGKDSALATPCQDYVHPDGDDWLDARCYFADNGKTDTASATRRRRSTLWDDDTPCDVATFTNLTRGETYDPDGHDRSTAPS